MIASALSLPLAPGQNSNQMFTFWKFSSEVEDYHTITDEIICIGSVYRCSAFYLQTWFNLHCTQPTYLDARSSYTRPHLLLLSLVVELDAFQCANKVMVMVVESSFSSCIINTNLLEIIGIYCAPTVVCKLVTYFTNLLRFADLCQA